MPIQRPLALALGFSLTVLLSAPHADAAPKKKKAAAAPAVSGVCADFYANANADWFKANPLPAGASSISALSQLADRAQQQQRELLDAAMNAPQGNVQKLLGDFWASGLDEAAVERDGANPIAPLLGRINAIKKSKDVPAAIAALHQVGIPVAFNFAPDVDLKALDRHIGYFMQGGLGLPDPAFYTRTDADTREVMGRYRNYVKQILALTGTPQNRLDADAQAVIDIETQLAKQAQSLAGLNNPFNNYAPIATKDLTKQYRNLQLDAFLKAQGVNDDLVSMADPGLFKQLDSMIASVKPDQWKAFFRWRVGEAMAPYLSKSFRDASFEFDGRLLNGLAAQPPRWQQVLDAINTAAGPMLGREYAARYLPQATDQRAETLAREVRDAQIAAVERSAWLSAEAKAEAKAKLQKLKIEVGTPRRDLDYTVQPMGRGSFGSNILIASTWRHREEMKRIGKGNADRRWDVLPQQPALIYDIAQNRLIVTAAILQPPVFDAGGNAAAQYGSYGAMVGYELNNAINNKGSQLDASGELRNWWTPADKEAWTGLGNRLVSQYDAYPYPELTGVKVNGRLTMDSNLSDQVGVELAWDSFAKAQPQADAKARQAFFKAWANLWPQRFTTAEATERVTADVRAPGQWRTNGPLSNMPTFAAAYSCKAGQPMQRKEADQTRIWP